MPHPLINEKFVSFVFVYAHPIAQRYRQRRTLLALTWKYGKSICDSVHPKDAISHSMKRRKGDYASCSVFSNNLENDVKKRIAC